MLASSHIIQHYRTLSQLVRHHRVILPKPRETWRLLQQPVSGHINALQDSMSGIAIATNGVMVAIEDAIADIVFFGHLEWFVKDSVEESDLDAFIIKKTKRYKTLDADFEEYVA